MLVPKIVTISACLRSVACFCMISVSCYPTCLQHILVVGRMGLRDLAIRRVLNGFKGLSCQKGPGCGQNGVNGFSHQKGSE